MPPTSIVTTHLQTFAVIGGGRWARVYLSVLADANLPFELAVVSTSNPDKITELSRNIDINIDIFPTIELLLKNRTVAVAAIINAAPLHYKTSVQLIEAGVPVIVEKPIAFNKHEVKDLCARALQKGINLAASLTFLHCSYIKRYAEFIQKKESNFIQLDLVWTDPCGETRYDESKDYDPGTSLAQDVMPHVWAILSTIVDQHNPSSIRVKSCSILHGGRQATFELSVANLTCRVMLEREAQTRQRKISAKMENGQVVALDFTVEPGIITSNSDSMSGDPNWPSTVRPVMKQLTDFLKEYDQPPNDVTLNNALKSIELVESSNELLKQQQHDWLSRLSLDDADDNILYALCELAAPLLYKKGLIRPGDRNSLRQLIMDTVQNHRESTMNNEKRAISPLEILRFFT